MRSKLMNIFLHFLNRDTQEIFGFCKEWDLNIHLLIKKGINAAVLLCVDDVYCFLPLGFWFESDYTRRALIECGEYIKAGCIRFSARESSIQEFIEKKQEQYSQFRSVGKSWEAYQNFFDIKILEQLLELHPCLIDRTIKIGQYCSKLWTKEHNQLILNNEGILLKIYSRIENLSDRMKIIEIICSAAEDIENPFVWTKVLDKISALNLKDSWIKKELRIYFEKNYYTLYLNEYNATNLYNFYPIDKKIDFHIEKNSNSIADYCWFEVFLGQLGLESLLEAPDWKIISIKKDYNWAILFQAYINICNKYIEENTNVTFNYICATSLQDHDTMQARDRIKEILNLVEDKRYMKIKNDKVDVLIMVATIDEEKAIVENDIWEEKQVEDEQGYTYYYHFENSMSFALARGINKGANDAAIAAQYFINCLKPKALAMVGFAAGKMGKVALGDVVVPCRVFTYDNGKQVGENLVLKEIEDYKIKDKWKQIVERFGEGWRESVKVEMPIGFDSQMIELLHEFRENDIREVNDIYDLEKYPNWKDLIDRLSEEDYIEKKADHKLAISESGKKFINDYDISYPRGFQEQMSKTIVGIMATGGRVQQWDGIFDELEKQDRKVCALEMESSGIGKISEFLEIPFIVAKGIGDYARDGKAFDNRFIEYACHASCRFVIEFFLSEKMQKEFRKLE